MAANYTKVLQSHHPHIARRFCSSLGDSTYWWQIPVARRIALVPRRRCVRAFYERKSNDGEEPPASRRTFRGAIFSQII
jgi:hypothetical protein